MNNIKIIDYKAGNSQSVRHALTKLGHASSFARNGSDLIGATHIILPGVGSAKATMDSLHDQDLLAELTTLIQVKRIPFLGICVGLQILFEHSEEGDVTCLCWLKGQVKKFDASTMRVPQMGWNKVDFQKGACGMNVEDQRPSDGYFYFVNSYYAVPTDPSDNWAIADYHHPFTAAVHRGNIFGTQFHVEKSGEAGLNLLNRFIVGGASC